MLSILKKQSCQSIFFRLMIIVGLFCPIYMSRQGSSYYPWFVLTNVFAVLFLVNGIVKKQFFIKKNQVGVGLIFLGLFLYNMFGLYINYKYLGLYGTQINVTIAILFFCALVTLKDYEFVKEGKIIDFLIKAVVISNLIGIMVYLTGYNGISFRGIPEFEVMDPAYYERRFNWIYLHKSQYALMLVLFIALLVAYKERFRNKWAYWGSLTVLIMGLIISHAYTSLCAAMFIFIGQFLDDVRVKGKIFNIKNLLFIIPLILVGGALVFFMAKERNILTLGGRVPIWLGSMDILKEYPNGIGSAFGQISFQIPNLSFVVYNCHNYFLNQMLCFSVRVGISFICIFVIIIIMTLRKKCSFLTVCVWIALLIPLNMDYALTPVELPIFLLVLFLIFWKSSVTENSVKRLN